MAKEFNVSRFPIREAVRMLTQEGLVESLPTRGTVVKAISQREVKEIFDVREALESLAARLAAEKVARGEATVLRDYVDKAREALAAGSRDAVASANAAFHDELIRFADSTVLQDALLPLLGRLHWLFRQVPDLESVCDDHDALCLAIEEGNPQLAVLEATRHVLHYKALTQRYLFPSAH